MKKTADLLLLSIIMNKGIACITCNTGVQEKIYDSTFLPNLFKLLSVFIVLGIIVAALLFFAGKIYRAFLKANPNSAFSNPIPLTNAAVISGIGIGGFIDGIVFHQVLQWHQMISNKIPPLTAEAKAINMFWDGIFHAFAFVVVFIGIILLWKLLSKKNINRSGKLFAGGLLMGCGLFNIVEGTINHHILKLHYVKEITGNIPIWNIAFLSISAVIFFIGFVLVKQRTLKH